MEAPSQRCRFITSWAGLGLTAPSFSPGTSTIATVPSVLGPIVLIVMDDVEGGWTVRGSLPRRAWDAMERELG